MRTTADGHRQYSREFKIAAVRRVLEGEELCEVARDLEIRYDVLWRWKKRVVEKGEDHLYQVGRRKGQPKPSGNESKARRIAELEKLVGRQQMEIGLALVNKVVFDGQLIESPQSEIETWH